MGGRTQSIRYLRNVKPPMLDVVHDRRMPVLFGRGNKSKWRKENFTAFMRAERASFANETATS